MECRKKRQWLKKENLIKAYSNGKCMCACCGEKQFEFLTIDHIGGQKTRIALGHGKNGKRKGVGLCSLLTREGFPHKDKLRILCHNCNQATSYGRVCPHKR